jgi:hypothetical protein
VTVDKLLVDCTRTSSGVLLPTVDVLDRTTGVVETIVEPN